MYDRIISFFNSPFALLIIGFIGTTVIGSHINNQYHEQEWKSKAKYTIFKEQLNEEKIFEEKILALSNQRYVLVDRVFNELVARQMTPARETWKEYYSVVKKWNNNLKANKNKITFLFNKELSKMFLDNKESISKKPISLHHSFRIAHSNVLKLLNCMKKSCKRQNILMIKSRNSLDTLWKINDEFAYKMEEALLANRNALINKY